MINAVIFEGVLFIGIAGIVCLPASSGGASKPAVSSSYVLVNATTVRTQESINVTLVTGSLVDLKVSKLLLLYYLTVTLDNFL